jgi:hypothetical protein
MLPSPAATRQGGGQADERLSTRIAGLEKRLGSGAASGASWVQRSHRVMIEAENRRLAPNARMICRKWWRSWPKKRKSIENPTKVLTFFLKSSIIFPNNYRGTYAYFFGSR